MKAKIVKIKQQMREIIKIGPHMRAKIIKIRPQIKAKPIELRL